MARLLWHPQGGTKKDGPICPIKVCWWWSDRPVIKELNTPKMVLTLFKKFSGNDQRMLA
jgi:hypothetical protein